jgi:hypothetical protein
VIFLSMQYLENGWPGKNPAHWKPDLDNALRAFQRARELGFVVGAQADPTKRIAALTAKIRAAKA